MKENNYSVDIEMSREDLNTKTKHSSDKEIYFCDHFYLVDQKIKIFFSFTKLTFKFCKKKRKRKLQLPTLELEHNLAFE